MLKHFAFLVGLVGSHSLFAAASPAIPLAFETNRGQAPAEVRYLARTASGTVVFRADAVSLPCGAGKSPMELLLPGAEVAGEAPTGGVANYYSGTDRKRWLEGAPLLERVRYRGVAPGIDLLFHGHNGELEYDIEIGSNADPQAFHLPASPGAAFRIEPDGTARLGQAGGCDGLRLLSPVAYQQRGKVRTAVESHFALDAQGGLTVHVGEYDHSLPLIIDPVVSFTKVIGAANSVTVSGLATDAAGNILITGSTYASNWPVVGGLNEKTNSQNQPFLTKLDPTGTQILYSTYLPLSGSGSSSAVAVDAQGNAYIVGIAGSSDLPVTSGNLGSCSSFCNAGFAAKFSGTGSLVYATYIGTGQQLPRAIAVDQTGSLYIGGFSPDAGLKTVGPGVCTNCSGPFFGKLTPDGTNWVYSSYFGAGSSYSVETYISALTLDGTGNLYIAGPGSAVPLKNSLMAGTGSSFVAELGPDGHTLLWSSILGGSSFANGDSVNALTVGADGTVFLAGATKADDFPYTVQAMRHPTYAVGYTSGYYNVYAAAINPARTGFSWLTYLGPGQVTSSTTDAAGNLYLGGSFNGGLGFKNALASDTGSAAILELDPKGNLLQATGFGGRDTYQVPSGMAVDKNGNLDIAGIPSNQVLSNGILDPINVGTSSYADQELLGWSTSFISYSAFIAQIAPTAAPQISLSYSRSPVELRNAGSADLHIGSIQGSAGTVQSNCGGVVPAGRSCYILAGGSTSLTINSDANPPSQTYTLPTSASSYQSLLLDTTQLYLPPTANGTTSSPRPLNITNVSSAPITISKILTFDAYSQTNNCIGALAPLATCTVQVSVTPVKGGSGSPDIGIFYNTESSSGFRDDAFASFTQNPSDGPLLLSVDQYGLQYGDVFLGTSSVVRSITVTNTGAAPLTLDDPSISGTGSAAFAVSSSTCAGATLQPQAACTIGVVFTPSSTGRLALPLTLSGGGSSVTAYLVGTGVNAPAFSLAPSALDFGAVTTGSNATQNLTLTNNSTTALTLTNINAGLNGGDAAGDYSQTNNCGTTLAANASCSIAVTFAPSAVGTRAGQATVLVNTGYGAQTSSLTGAGSAPFALAPSNVAFGQVAAGTSAAASITLQNVTSVPQAFTVSQVAAPFQLDATACTSPLPANASCKLVVTFTPTVLGAQNATWQIGFSGTLSTQVALTGTGATGTATVSSSSYDFGTVPEGNTVSNSFTLSNVGDAPLTGIAIAISGANAGDFASSGSCGASLAAGASCTIDVTFKPSTAGSENATLTVSGSAQNGPQTLQLAGAGTSPTFTVTASSGSSTVSSGGVATYSLTIQANPGDSGTLTLGCSGLPAHASCAFVPGTISLAAGGTATLTVSTRATATASNRLGGLVALCGFCLLPFGWKRHRFLSVVVLSLGLIGAAGCGQSSSAVSQTGTTVSTAAGTYSFNVTATNGTEVKLIPLTLTVQ